MATDYSKDFNFITDRLAIGSLASRSTPGFVETGRSFVYG